MPRDSLEAQHPSAPPHFALPFSCSPVVTFIINWQTLSMFLSSMSHYSKLANLGGSHENPQICSPPDRRVGSLGTPCGADV